MKERNIKVTKNARYYLLGEPGPQITTIWFVCHGYGFLALDFLQNFTPLDDGNTLVVSPEGLHRFYLKGTSGRVGASWMTKEDRLNDIEDYTNYLDEVYKQVMTDVVQSKVKINILGFSQGTATVIRWVVQRQPRVDNLLVWSGLFPTDIDFVAVREVLNSMGIFIFTGTHDPLTNFQQLTDHVGLLIEKGINHHLIVFEGGHELTPVLLEKNISSSKKYQK